MEKKLNTNIRHAGLLKFKANVTELEKQAFFIPLLEIDTMQMSIDFIKKSI